MNASTGETNTTFRILNKLGVIHDVQKYGNITWGGCFYISMSS